MGKISIYRYESKQLFDINKERFNPYQVKSGAIPSKADKARNRNSREAKALKNELKQYCY